MKMTTKKTVESGIIRGMKQALAFMEGTADPRTYRVHIPHEIDVRRIRIKLGLTQAQFAARFGFSVDTLRHWEQGRRVPDGAARAYLIVIDRAPKAVAKALKAA
jgi:putative transcriptional regulator